MNYLIALENISLDFGYGLLLDKTNLAIEQGERVCLIGRNGAGKSSLLKVIEGQLSPDSGTVRRKPHLRIARLSQELPQNISITVFEFVASSLAGIGKVLADYHTLIQKLSAEPTQADLNQLQELQHKIDTENAWQFDQKISAVLSRLNLNPELKMAELSGGWQRRAALAQALVTDPELLLLDEPTNHLDIEAIQWLEDHLLSWNIGLVFITHDRSLLQRLATRIIELDRGSLTSWPGDYANFLRRKEEMLHAEAKQNEEFDKKLAQEEKWIRQGIKARRTRNEGRVRELKALRAERAKRREVQGTVSFEIGKAEKSGQLVIEAKHIRQQFHHHAIIDDFSVRIMRGDRIGLIGPNGIGKSTLLNILLGHLTPQEGSVHQGTKLQVAYFDQLRAALDPEKTVADNVSYGNGVIEINGKERHIISYLGDFLFTPQRALTKVKALSGGECNRLLLARLFSQPANVLVLDEPTNDLDIETLELLEDLLCGYQGTLLVVSHDRAFLDNVVTSTLVFEGNGKIQEYVGGYEDWLRQKESPSIAKRSTKEKNITTSDVILPSPTLTYQEQKEIKELPQKIEYMEAEQQKLQEAIAHPDFYQDSQDTITKKLADLAALTENLAQLYQRWEALENRDL